MAEVFIHWRCPLLTGIIVLYETKLISMETRLTGPTVLHKYNNNRNDSQT